MSAVPKDHVIVLFGATGDLAKRKLLPGLFHLAVAGLLPPRYRIIGTSPDPRTRCPSRIPQARTRHAIAEFGTTEPEGEAWKSFEDALTFAAADGADPTPLRRRRARGRERDRRTSPAPLPPGRSARWLSDRSIKMLGAHRLGPGGQGHRREAFRHRPGFGPGPERDGARRVRRGAHLSHRPLPGQGIRGQHPRFPLRQRALRADLEPRAHRLRADRRPRDTVDRGAGRLLRGNGGVPRHDRHPPLPGPGVRRHGAPDLALGESAAGRKAEGLRLDARRSTPDTSCGASTTATLPSRGWRPTLGPRPSSPSVSRSTTGAGPASPSTCAPASRSGPAAR